LGREAKIVTALAIHSDLTSRELTPLVYDDVDTALHGLAERSLLAHLIKLEEDGRASRTAERWRLL